MNKWIMVGIAVASLTVCLEASAAKKGGKGGAQQDITISGTVTQEEMTRKSKDGEKTMTVFMLTTADGAKIKLPKAKGEDAVDLSEYVDKEVTIVGKGKVMERKGKKQTMLMKIESIEEGADGGAGEAEGKGDGGEGEQME